MKTNRKGSSDGMSDYYYRVKEKYLRRIREFICVGLGNFLFIGLGCCIMAIGLNAFLLPNELVVGVSGLSKIFVEWLGAPQPILYAVFSISILLLGVFKKENDQDKGDFLYKSFTGICMLSFIFLPLTARLSLFRLPIPEAIFFLELPINAIIGGFIFAIGITIVIAAGASTAGPDLIAVLIVERNKNIKLKHVMRIIDFSVLAAGVITFQTEIFSLTNLIYVGSVILTLFLLSSLIDSKWVTNFINEQALIRKQMEVSKEPDGVKLAKAA